MNWMDKQASPCLHCTRVRDPENCENKQCKVWRKWFVGRWDQIRAYPRQAVDEAPPRPVGVCIGGQHYAAPHQVKAYLQKDPCEACVCPVGLCSTPCRIKKVWEATVQEVQL